MSNHLTIKQTAGILNLSESQVRRLLSAGILLGFAYHSRMKMIEESSIYNYLQSPREYRRGRKPKKIVK